MTAAAGVRITWADIPARVRAGVEEILGDTVVEATSQPGGFSPGSADRLVTAGGRRAFVKAANPALNMHTPKLYRREARITAQLPPGVPAARLIDVYDDGDWVALVLTDIDGRHPYTPWLADEVRGVLTALDELAAQGTPCPLPDVPRTVDRLRDDLSGWQRLRDDPWPGLPTVPARHLDTLVELGTHGVRALDGDTLVHTDVRADNLLVRPDRSVVVVDWPGACRGCDWLDSLLLLVNVELYGERDVEAIRSQTRLLQRVPDEDIDGVLAGLCGGFYDAARQPAPPGLPTVRRFQRDQGDAVFGWLARRRDWTPPTPTGR